MIANIEVPLWSNTKPNKINYLVDERRCFPLLSIDVDSYIVGATIESFIVEKLEDGIYNLQVGKYCAISEDILFLIDMNHDYLSVYQGCISALREDRTYSKTKCQRKGQIIIENDCWIGSGVTILGGVTIHNGAVVAAKSVVTKDVPPYSIVGGNPARIIRYRFSDEIIHKLLRIEWWNWDSEIMKKRKQFMSGSIDDFVNEFYRKELEQNPKSPIKRMTDGDLYVFYLDMNEEFPIYEKIIKQFVVGFDNTNHELLLYLDPREEYFNENTEKLLQLIETYQDKNCYINIYSEELEVDTDILSGADYYISNRLYRNLERMCKASLYGLQCLSGVDSDIFYAV